MSSELALVCAGCLLTLALAWRFRRPPAGAMSPDLLVRALEREDQLRAELPALRQQLQHLEGFSQQLAALSGQQFPPLADLMLATLAGLVPSQSQALFVPGEQDWSCPAISSPHRERVTSAALAGLREPALEEARQSRLLSSQPCPPGETQFSATKARPWPSPSESLLSSTWAAWHLLTPPTRST